MLSKDIFLPADYSGVLETVYCIFHFMVVQLHLLILILNFNRCCQPYVFIYMVSFIFILPDTC